MSFGAIADAANAISRLSNVFEAELLDDTLIRDPTLEFAIVVKGASFTWDSSPANTDSVVSLKKANLAQEGWLSKKDPEAENMGKDDRDAFKVQDIDLCVPRGQLVAIVGAVGSGKTSLLQGIIGEMRRTEGSITFGGSVAYCPQSAWIQVRNKYSSVHHFNGRRMPQSGKTYALVAHLTREDTGKLYTTHV